MHGKERRNLSSCSQMEKFSGVTIHLWHEYFCRSHSAKYSNLLKCRPFPLTKVVLEVVGCLSYCDASLGKHYYGAAPCLLDHWNRFVPCSGDWNCSSEVALGCFSAGGQEIWTGTTGFSESGAGRIGKMNTNPEWSIGHGRDLGEQSVSAVALILLGLPSQVWTSESVNVVIGQVVMASSWKRGDLD